VRFSTYGDTPLPPDEPTGQNPADGALIHYLLRAPAAGLVTLEISDASGRLVRRYRSDDPRPIPADIGHIPAYWLRPAPELSRAAGLHRFVWDLHETPPPSEPSYPMSAAPQDTPAEPRGPWVLPGQYQVKLTVGEGPQAVTSSAALTVEMDPRVKTPPAALQAQHALSLALAEAMRSNAAATARLAALKQTLEQRLKESPGKGQNPGDLLEELRELTGAKTSRRRASGGEARDLGQAQSRLARLYELAQQADLAPTPQVAASGQQALTEERALEQRVEKLNEEAAKGGPL
jgi:hypothetical protein